MTVAALMIVALPSASAEAAKCPSSVHAGECLRVTVPLDRSGTVPGSVRLLVTRDRSLPTFAYEARAAVDRPPLLVLSDGPGRSGVDAYENGGLDYILGPHDVGRDVVAMDLRGTGHSGALRCPSLSSMRSLADPAAGAACASSLGPRRALYTAADSAEDIDAVRSALGADRLAIYGLGHGSEVALAYARRHPARVDRLVLDSPVGPEGLDPLNRSAMRAAPRLLRTLCGGRACKSFTPDAGGDLARLARRLQREPARGLVTDRRGRTRPARIGAAGLLDLIAGHASMPGGLEPLPAAIRSALRGDIAPLLHLRRFPRALRRVPLPEGWLGLGAYAAAVCEGSNLPWDPAASPSERRSQAEALVDAIAPVAFAPFGGATALASDTLALCARWPGAGATSVPAESLPPVPALVLAGGLDFQAPVEDARAVASALGGAELLVVRHAGHGVLGSGEGPFANPCVARAMRRFLDGREPDACGPVPRAQRQRPWQPVPPTLGRQRPSRGVPGRRGRTLTAVKATVRDAGRDGDRALLLGLLRSGALGGTAGVLRGGTVTLHHGSGVMVLRRASVVRGVRVSGVLTIGGEAASAFEHGRLLVHGPRAARGRLVVKNAVARGRLGGRRVSARLALPGSRREASLATTASVR